MTRTQGVHHITLIVSDLRVSKKFYQNVCGMDIIFDEEDVCGLTDGSFSLWLAHSKESDLGKTIFNPETTGLNHWSFRVDTPEELKEIEAHLKELEIEMEDGSITDDDYGGKAIFTKDPDGMKVEFHLQE